jgi:hypothetical protein
MNAIQGLAGAAAIVLVGCATGDVVSPRATHSPQCTQAQCNYTIQVYSCDKRGIVPEYDVIHVAKGTHRIHWVIVSPGFTFATDGIAFPGNPSELSNGTRVTPKEFSWTDTNASAQGAPPKGFKYDIRILDNGGRTCLHDPSVVND